MIFELPQGIAEATAQLERSKRRLGDVPLEFMHRGGSVRIAVGGREVNAAQTLPHCPGAFGHCW